MKRNATRAHSFLNACFVSARLEDLRGLRYVVYGQQVLRSHDGSSIFFSVTSSLEEWSRCLFGTIRGGGSLMRGVRGMVFVTICRGNRTTSRLEVRRPVVSGGAVQRRPDFTSALVGAGRATSRLTVRVEARWCRVGEPSLGRHLRAACQTRQCSRGQHQRRQV